VRKNCQSFVLKGRKQVKKINFLWIKIVLLIITTNLHGSKGLVRELISRQVQGIREESIAQIITSSSWVGLYAPTIPFVEPKSDFWKRVANFEDIFLYKKTGYPKKWYKIARTLFNVGDMCMSQGDLSKYVAKKSSDWLLTEIIGGIANLVGKRFDSTILKASAGAQIPFRHFDEIMIKSQSNESQTLRKEFSKPLGLLFALLRCLIKGTIGRFITIQLYHKWLPCLCTKIPPHWPTTKLFRKLETAFKHTDLKPYLTLLRQKLQSQNKVVGY
jgi:hypothetical protein